VELPSPEQKVFYEQAASQYQRDLSSDTAAQDYLKGRGIGPELAGLFRLGSVQSPLLGHENYRSRLAIPYITPGGVVNFTFRCIENHVCKDVVRYVDDKGKEHTCRKYLAADGERTLFNVGDFKREGNALYVCEGEIDTLTLSACGFPSIGIPGVKNWKAHYTRCFADYVDGGQLFCVADGDAAGAGMARFLSQEIKARPIRPPKGEDINSIYSKGGADAVRTWLSGATS